MRTPALLWAAGLLVHALWALAVPGPSDWDPAYYSEVARHIAAGHGAVTNAAWLHAALPASLPQPADLHWMPLPSRVLVLEAWLGGWGQVTTVLLGALWAPLAWALARAVGAPGRTAVLAGLLAATGLGYARFLSTPDSIALYGVLGGLGFLAVATQHRSLPLVAAAAALTRGDGFLLGLAWSGRGHRLLAGAAGLLAFAGWQARGLWLGGERFLALRGSTAQALFPEGATCAAPASGLGERLHTVGGELLDVLVVPLIAGAGLVPLLALVGAWTLRTQPVVRRGAAYTLLFPPIVIALAPAVGGSGTVFRSLSAVAPLACALAAVGIAAWIRARALHPGVAAALGLAVAGTSVTMGVLYTRSAPERDWVCPEAEGAVFASDPFFVAFACDQPAVLLAPCHSPEQVQAAAALLAIDQAWFPAGRDGEVGASFDEAEDLLQGWSAVGTRERLAPEGLR